MKKYVQFSARAVRRPDTEIILRIFIFWRMRTVQDHQQRNNSVTALLHAISLVRNFYLFFYFSSELLQFLSNFCWIWFVHTATDSSIEGVIRKMVQKCNNFTSIWWEMSIKIFKKCIMFIFNCFACLEEEKYTIHNILRYYQNKILISL